MAKWSNQSGILYEIHSKKDCKAHNCPFHNPSDHHMKDWAMNIRTDMFKYPLVERICPRKKGEAGHGIGHPDPDSFAYLVKQDVENGMSEEDAQIKWGIHGCDGCCHES